MGGENLTNQVAKNANRVVTKSKIVPKKRVRAVGTGVKRKFIEQERVFDSFHPKMARLSSDMIVHLDQVADKLNKENPDKTQIYTGNSVIRLALEYLVPQLEKNVLKGKDEDELLKCLKKESKKGNL